MKRLAKLIFGISTALSAAKERMAKKHSSKNFFISFSFSLMAQIYRYVTVAAVLFVVCRGGAIYIKNPKHWRVIARRYRHHYLVCRAQTAYIHIARRSRSEISELYGVYPVYYVVSRLSSREHSGYNIRHRVHIVLQSRYIGVSYYEKQKRNERHEYNHKRQKLIYKSTAFHFLSAAFTELDSYTTIGTSEPAS
jgi:hypothetical protein